MGRKWDYFVPSANTWAEILRVLKPGASGLFFGGPRTFHRMAVAIEDGGFECRDVIMYLFGSGFPKSHNVSRSLDERAGEKRPVVRTESRLHGYAPGADAMKRGDRSITASVSDLAKAYDGYGTSLKPSYEPCLLVRKPLEGTVDENVAKWGTGAIAIDASRIGAAGGPAGRDYAKTGLFGIGGKATIEQLGVGRWPSNVIFSHDEACEDGAKPCVEGCPVRMLDEQSGKTKTPALDQRGRAGMFGIKPRSDVPCYGDEGGASRFFYTAKASRAEREQGLHDRKKVAQGADALRDGDRAASEVANTHTTVKPIDLCRYLARLILPPKTGKPRRILVPYSGSGSEMIACLQAGWDEVVGIEREAEYIEIAKARLTKGGVLSNLMRERERLQGASRPFGKTSIMRRLRSEKR